MRTSTKVLIFKSNKFSDIESNLLKIHFRKQRETRQIIANKLEEATQRKQQLQNEKIMNKQLNGMINFKRHWQLREDARLRSVQTLELYEREKRESMAVSASFSKNQY